MIETVEKFVRTNALLLMWGAVAGWAAIGLGTLGLSFQSRCRDRRAWLGSAALALLFAVEMAFPLRYTLTDRLRAVLRTVGGEEAVRGRRSIQAIVALILLVVVSGLLAALLVRARRLATPGKLSVLGIGVGLLGFVLETISLHQVDQYYTIYWSIWYAGLALAVTGVVWSFMIPDGAASTTGPWPHARYSVSGFVPPPHARYPVRSPGIRDARDDLVRRMIRLGLVMLALALPELVDLVSWLIGVSFRRG